jgi:endoglucanase
MNKLKIITFLIGITLFANAQTIPLTLHSDTINTSIRKERLQPQTDRSQAFERNSKMAKGIVWNGMAWNMYYNLAPEKDMKIIKERGFQSVRIPVDWLPYVDGNYTISPDFFNNVDRAIQAALNNKLFPFIDISGGGEDPSANYKNLITLWEQIASHYSNWSDSLMFEILNEPGPPFTIQRYNQFQNEALTKIRETNPNRIVIITVFGWSDFSNLPYADIPDDPNLIITLHNYSTHEITHQGATFLGEYANAFLGTVWSGSVPEYTEMESFAQSVKEFSDVYHIPVNIGEFGCFSNAGIETKYRWLNALTRMAEKYGHSWNCFDYGNNVYSPLQNTTSLYIIENQSWIDPITQGLVDDPVGTPKNNTTVLFENNFESGIAPFELSFWNPVQNKVSVVNQNGEAKITVNESLENDWDAHLSCHFDSLQVGHYYSLSVDLWSDSFRSIGLNSGYSSISVMATPTKRKYCNVFRVNNQISFSPYFHVFTGKSTGSIYVDNFKIEEINVELAESVSINEKNLVIDSIIGKFQLSATVLSMNADERSVKWALKSNEIATIDEFGFIRPTGKEEGTFWVFATTKDGTKLTDSTQITLTNQQIGKLKNGSFSNGFTYWSKQGGRVYPEIKADSILNIQTYLKYDEPFVVSVRQKNISIEKGKSYTLSFRARSYATRDIYIFIGMEYEPWTNYINDWGDVKKTLTSEWQDFKIDFKMNNNTDPRSIIVFNFGNDTIDWELDDVSFQKVDSINSGKVTFQVNLQNKTISQTGVFMMGSWDDWTSAIKLNNTTGEIYSTTLTLIPGNNIDYKYYNGNPADNWEEFECENFMGDCTDEWTNRFFIVPEESMELEPVCFNSCNACPVSDSVNVTFRVDMQNVTVTASGVNLNGSFSNWAIAKPMQILSGGAVYTTTLKLKKGETVEYKFVNGGVTDWAKYEILAGLDCAFGNDANRGLVVPDKDTILNVVCFANCTICSLLSVNEKKLNAIAVFPNPVKDILTISGLTKKNSKIMLFKIDGVRIKEFNNGSNKSFDLDMCSCQSGIYILCIENELNREYFKVIKE